MLTSVKDLINESDDEIFTMGKVSNEKIMECENKLNIVLPKDFIIYLSKFGYIMGYGIEFLGIAKDGSATFVEQTLRFRNKGLEKKYIVIRNADEWVYCLNVNNNEISSWDEFGKNHIVVSNNFFDYIYCELNEAKKDWD